MLTLDGNNLDLEALAPFLGDDRPRVGLSEGAREAVGRARAAVEEILADGRTVYGINTGFGKLARTRIEPDRLRELQRNLLLSHAAGVGRPLPDEVVRLALLLRANALVRGHSGIRRRVVDALLTLLNEDILPVIPSQGSVGASGDLAPLAHLAIVLIGEGRAKVKGEVVPGADALKAAGLEPLELEAKEGLALINGTQISTAIGAAALIRLRRLLSTADVACAMTLEALRGSIAPFDARVAALRPHAGHAEVAANVRDLMTGSKILGSHADCDRVQDQYSLRCVPQVHGAVRDAIRHVIDIVETEINSVTDNPLIFPADGDVISAGNFHAEPVAIPFDYAAAATSELASISERRIESLVNPDLSGLAPFLAGDPGVDSGFMIAQVTAAALVSENKSLAHPASVDSIPTSANQEDHVSMAPIAARKLAAIVENTTYVLAIELLAALEGLDRGDGLAPGRGVGAARAALRAVIPPRTHDRVFDGDIAAARGLIEDGALLAAVEAAGSRIT